jgi:cytochrome P450
MSAN